MEKHCVLTLGLKTRDVPEAVDYPEKEQSPSLSVRARESVCFCMPLASGGENGQLFGACYLPGIF